MLGSRTSTSTSTWSQSDLEDLGDTVLSSSGNPHSNNDPIHPNQPLSISLDFLKSGEDHHPDDKDHLDNRSSTNGKRHISPAGYQDQSFSYKASQDQDRGRQWPSQRLPPQASPLVSSAGPRSPFASPLPTWEHNGGETTSVSTDWTYRRTSALVDGSDPIVPSSSSPQRSQRSESLARSFSRDSRFANGSSPWSAASPSFVGNGTSPGFGTSPASLQYSSHQTKSTTTAPSSASAASFAAAAASGSPSSESSWAPELRATGSATATTFQHHISRPQEGRTEQDVSGFGSSPSFVPWTMKPSSSEITADAAPKRGVDGLRIDARSGTRTQSPMTRLGGGGATEYSGSPRGLETMPEGEEAADYSGSAHRYSDDQAQRQSQHSRLRSTSSAAAFRPAVGSPSRGDAWGSYDRGNGPQSASPYTAESQRPAFATWRQDSADSTKGGEQTARQSPIERRVALPPPGESNFSPVFRNHDPEGRFPLPPVAGTESRRHSISTGPHLAHDGSGGAVGAQRRAVGFELREGTTNTSRSVSVDRQPAYYPSETPRGRGPAAFSEDDLAAEMGHLQSELGRISLAQQEAGSSGASISGSAGDGGGNANVIHMRVPSSQAAAIGLHSSSMPPVFGERGSMPRGLSQSDWEAVLSPRASNQEGRRGEVGLPSYPGPHHISASRSASLGPGYRAMTPPEERARRQGTFAPQDLSVDRQQMPRDARAYDSATNPYRISSAFGGHGGILPGSLKSTSATGIVESGVTASAGTFSPHGSQQLPRSNSSSSHFGSSPPGAYSMDRGLSASSGGLNEYTFGSLATLGPMPPMAGGGGPMPQGMAESSAALQNLGRGVPLSQLPRDTPLYIVGFKQGRTDLFFRYIDPAHSGRREEAIQREDLVIVEADRGKDIGRVVNDSITIDQVRQFLAQTNATAAGGDPTRGGSGTALRSINPKRLYSKASPADMSLLASKAMDEERALQSCLYKVAQRGLPMRIIAAEFQFDRRKLTFFFVNTTPGRVDFRGLVTDLFKSHKSRIWMCQIGSGSASSGPPGVGGPGPSIQQQQQGGGMMSMPPPLPPPSSSMMAPYQHMYDQRQQPQDQRGP